MTGKKYEDDKEKQAGEGQFFAELKFGDAYAFRWNAQHDRESGK
jgi:hypothetical protein